MSPLRAVPQKCYRGTTRIILSKWQYICSVWIFFVKNIPRLANKPIPLLELNEPYCEENGRSVEGPWHKRYIALYKKTASFDKHNADRYDGMSGGHYIDGVLGLYCDGIITDEEIDVLSDEPRELLKRYKQRLQ